MKLDLRRHFLDRYPAKRPIVFDACAGTGVLWTRLRTEYDVRYWGVDVKKARGRLAIDSERVLAQPGWKFEIVDIDTYGSPWTHWLALLPHVTRPLTVFLTMGNLTAGDKVDHSVLQACGMSVSFLATLQKNCATLKWNLGEHVVAHCLSKVFDYKLRVVEAVRTVSPTGAAGSRAHYFGLRIEPA